MLDAPSAEAGGLGGWPPSALSATTLSGHSAWGGVGWGVHVLLSMLQLGCDLCKTYRSATTHNARRSLRGLLRGGLPAVAPL
jgi:hypothetical protein